ncbi:MAG TPA: diguanylate cyclase, partial [Anaerolineales bacterium]|nr:diguanylate cyclase [Anaerolineales bacterium]
METRVFADGTLRGRIKIPELSPELRKAISSKPDNMPALEQLRALWPTLDQSDRTQAAYWLMHKMQFDPVSGLETIFSMQMETGKPEGWMSGISDLNGLGAINDHWGQDAGNRVVSRMGDVINEEVARVGSRAFRTGGDEVTYWFPSEEAANQALRAIDTRFQNATINVEYEGQLVPQKGFSLSYGTGSEEKIADEALYEDKEFRSRLGQRAERGQIPRSIHRDNGEEGLSHGVQVDRISNLGRDRTAEVNREELIAKAAELETAIQEQSAAAQKAIYGDQAPAAGSPNESLKQNLANRLGPSLGKETGKSIDALGEKARGWAREHGFDENATAAYLMERMRGAKDPAKLLKQVLSTEGMPADMRSAMQHLREYQDALHKPRPEWSPIEKALTLDRPVSDEELSQYPFLQAAFDKKTESYPMTNGLEIKKLANLTPAQRIVEARFVEAINNNLPDIIEKYWQSRGEGERNVLAVDLIRELSPDYALNEKSRMAYTQAVRAPALALFDKMYELKLAEPLTGDFARDFVATKAGAPGSGKNGAIGNVKELAAKFKDAHLVLDVTLSDPSALHLLDDALKSGRRLLSVFVARDPIKALMEGIVPRAQEGEGRSILLEQWARAHAGAPETFRRALIKYAGNPDVELRVVDNTRGLQEPHDVPIHLIHDFLKDRIYNEKVLRQRGIEELEKGVQDGRIRPDVYQAITGYDFGGEGGLYEQLAARRAKVVGARSLPRVGEPGYGRTDQPDEIERPGGSTEGARSVGGGGTQETSGVSGWGNREVQEAATEGNRRGSEKAAGQQGLKPETAGKLPPEVKALLPIGRGPVVEQLRKAWPKMDASMQAEVMNWLVNKVLYDPISGLETTFSKIAEEGKPAGWVDAISDLNALKAINDHMGHGAGNLVISRMGQIIREKVQAVSGRAFRVGGDEVSYWFPNEEAANQALRAIDEEFQNDIIKFELDDGQRVRMKGFTLSYGIGSDEKLADKALYADKEIRRGLGQRDERGQLPRSIHRVDGEEGAQNKNSVHRNTEEANRGELTAEAANGGTSASAPYRDKSLYTPGVYDKIAGHLPEAEILSEVWADQMAPLLEAMRFETLKGDLREFKFTDLPPETQAALREWVNKVKHEDMPTAKLQTIKFAEWLRDETLLNYNRRTPFGELIDVPAPYRYWATESMLKHGLRAIDSPAWFATLARLSAFSNAYQRQMPERLRGKVRIRIPFAPSWMRSSLFVDPRRATFP